jgi:hypothetical protein
MPFTSIADHATEVSGLTTSGANARVQGGETDLQKVPLSGGRRRRSRKSHSKRRSRRMRMTRGGRRRNCRTAKK